MAVTVLHGTVEITHETVPGSSDQARVLNIPAISDFPASGAPVPYLSRIVASDPADQTLFKYFAIGEISNTNPDPELDYVGGRSITFIYQLSGGAPIEVDLYLVWDTEAPDLNGRVFQYSGG